MTSLQVEAIVSREAVRSGDLGRVSKRRFRDLSAVILVFSMDSETVHYTPWTLPLPAHPQWGVFSPLPRPRPRQVLASWQCKIRANLDIFFLGLKLSSQVRSPPNLSQA